VAASRVIEIHLGEGTAVGSGYRVGPRLVLTARHVLEHADEGVRVRPLGGAERIPATVAWRSEEHDVALLEVAGFEDAVGVRATRWGRIGQLDLPCQATGFPRAMQRDGSSGGLVRDATDVYGRLDAASAAKRPVADLSVAGSVPLATGPGTSPWGGMSGAAVRCGPLIVGVVDHSTAAYGPDRLGVTLISAVHDDPGFAVFFGRDRLEDASYPRALHPPYRPLPDGDPPPALLLQPEYEVVPFTGRERELAELVAWCEDGAGVSARLLLGPGGYGKSRLAAELCRRRHEAGWTAGLAGSLVEDDADSVRELFARPGDILVVVDWAELYTERIAAVLDGAADAEERVRVLILARSVDGWRDQAAARAEGIAAEAIRLAREQTLAPLEPSGEEQREAYAAAVRAFGLDEAPELPPEPAALDSMLALHAAALLAAQGEYARDPVRELVAREDSRRWEPEATRVQLGLDRVRRYRGVAVSTLTAAADEATAIAALGALPELGASEDRRYAVAYWLRALYTGAFLSPLRPDLLGEALVAAALDEKQDLAARLFGVQPRPWAARALTVLTRAAASRGARVRSALAGVLEQHLEALLEEAADRDDHALAHALAAALTQTGDAELAARAEAELPDKSVVMREPAEATYAILAAAPGQSAERAERLRQHARWLGRLGRRDTAVAPAEEAVEILRAEGAPALARALRTLANRYRAVGRREEAIEAIEESVKLSRVLAKADPGEPLVELASALSVQANSLGSVGRHQAALEATAESLEIRRGLGEPADLASALSNHSGRLDTVNRKAEALAAAEEAVAIRTELAERDADQYEAELARALASLASRLARCGRHEEALAPIARAVEIRRRLVRAQPAAFRLELSRALVNQSARLAKVGRADEALAAAREALELRGRLSAEFPSVYRAEQASALVNLGRRLAEAELSEEARQAFDEAIALSEPLAAEHPASRAQLARTLLRRSKLLAQAGRDTEAAGDASRAVDLYRSLSADEPQAYRARLAEALATWSARLAAARREREALAPAEEALAIRERLAAEFPGAFDDELGRSQRQVRRRREAPGG
jgi:Trypsin-like peptidase domain/Tetratricopeptide repeat